MDKNKDETKYTLIVNVDNDDWSDDEFYEKTERTLKITKEMLKEIAKRYLKLEDGEWIDDVNLRGF